jgi:hypothetical protein
MDVANHQLNCPLRVEVAQIKLELAASEARSKLNRAWLSALWAVLGGSVVLVAKALFGVLAK